MVKPNPEEAPAYEILKMIFGILAVLLNGILLIAMLKDRKRIFVSRISYLVANLALADFLTGLAVVFVVPDNLRHEDTPEDILKYKLSIIWTPMTISFLTLFVMSAERLVVIALPMIWTTILTIPRTIVCIVLIWGVSIVGGILMDYYTSYTQFVLVLLMELCALFFVVIHVYILWLLRKSEKQRKMSQIETSQSTPWVPPDTPNQISPVAHGKVTAVVAILLVVLIITFFPHFVCLQMFTANAVIDKTISQKIDGMKFMKAYYWTDALSYLNFVVNPIVYAWRLRMYRRAFSGLFNCTE